MSDSDNSRKRALECMRLVADCMQLAGDVHSPSRPLQPIRKDLMIRFRHASSDGGDYGDAREVCEEICCAAER